MKNSERKGKIIVLSAPSGTGKSTIIGELMKKPELKLDFSISATSRAPRGEEQHGKEYFFMSEEEFKKNVDEGNFVEWEEVYSGICYGTLVSEVDRITGKGHNLIMDVDVKGGLNIKKRFGEEVLTIFIMPPSKEILEQRLRNRGTDSAETIEKRLKKSEFEMSFAEKFDTIIVNDNLEEAVEETEERIREFIREKE
ncbi:MAG: guanylate kinase [Muribaculaceae bacterium]|nr:guanylate kinase [Muribaculaceae bacterium]